MTRSSLLLLGFLATAGLGCQNTGMPQFLAPGPAQYQRARAQHFDPYPDTDVTGDADMSGARPRDFDRPPPEASRARWPQWGVPRYGS